MKKLFLLALVAGSSAAVYSQQTAYYLDPAAKFKEAKEYFQKEQYSLAYPLLKQLKQDVRETDIANHSVTVQEIGYYTTVCALKQGESRAEGDAIDYIDLEKNTARVQMMNYHLAEYYFARQNFTRAVDH